MVSPTALLAKCGEKLQEKKTATRLAFSSRENFMRALETDTTAHGNNEERTICKSCLFTRVLWKNEDLDLSPPKAWSWGWYDYGAFWWSYGFSVGVWSVGSSMVAMGLNSWQAIICVFVSHLLGAIAIAWHSRIGAKWHCGFPVECRISWGIYASFFPILVRLLVGQIWASVLLMQAGYFLSIIFRCVFESAWHDLPNTLPESADITVQNLIAFILFIIISAPLLAIPPHHMRRIFTIKSVLLPPVAIGLFAFCIVQGRSASGSSGSFTTAKPAPTGTALAWAMLSAINSCMGKTSTQAVNQTDLARYARTPNSPFWSQLIALPVGNTLCAALGIFATSATQRAWGVTLWNPWDLCTEILDRHWNSGARAAIAFASMGWILSIYASNLGVNLFPFGADVTAILPKYLNIRRGMYLCYTLALVIMPWKILKSSTTFMRFLGGYSIFLAPLVGIFITDYFVVRKGNIWADDLFRPVKESAYYYRGGVSWRCIVAFVITVVVVVPGFAAQFGHNVGVGWERIYALGWVLGCTISSVVYWSLAQIGDFCTKERGMRFEESYDLQAMFTGDATAGSRVVADEDGERGVAEVSAEQEKRTTAASDTEVVEVGRR